VWCDDDMPTLLQRCRAYGVMLRTAESCTAGAIAAGIASVSGASDVLDRGWVTYSNQAKMEELGVPELLLTDYGAVSREVVMAMAEGGCDTNILCVAVSGIAGPSGGSVEKPVGTVWIATAMKPYPVQARAYHFSGTRHEVQRQTVAQAMQNIMQDMTLWCGGVV